MFFELFKKQKGQGLIETTIALSIIMAALGGGISLTIRSLSGSQESRMSIVAANLAREGIEVVRNIRDTNWIEEEAWNSGLSDEFDFTATANFDPTPDIPTWELDFVPDNFDICMINDSCRLYLGPDGPYKGIYSQLPLITWKETPFYRLITLNQICEDGLIAKGEGGLPGTCNQGIPVIGLQVISEVKWTVRDKIKELSVEERIYNWK